MGLFLVCFLGNKRSVLGLFFLNFGLFFIPATLINRVATLAGKAGKAG